MIDLQAGDVTIAVSAIGIDPTALHSIPFEQFAALLDSVQRRREALRWAMGDLLTVAEMRFGEEWAQLVDVETLSYETLRHFRTIARGVPYEVRRAELSFGHHAAVCGLPTTWQAELLGKAVVEGWDRDTMRLHARAWRAKLTADDKDAYWRGAEVALPAVTPTPEPVQQRPVSRDTEPPEEGVPGAIGRWLEQFTPTDERPGAEPVAAENALSWGAVRALSDEQFAALLDAGDVTITLYGVPICTMSPLTVPER